MILFNFFTICVAIWLVQIHGDENLTSDDGSIDNGILNTSKQCGGNWTFNWTTPLPYSTASPIDIHSQSEANHIHMDCPFQADTTRNELQEMTISNTGSLVEIYNTIDGSNWNITFCGGVLNSTYFYKKGFIYWSRNINVSAGSTVDGEIAPLFGLVIFQNSKYITFEDALQYRDGLAIFEFGILVRPDATNSGFTKFYNYFEKILNAGQNATAPDGSVLWKWMVPTTDESNNVYVYPGSYKDPEGVQHDCATVISWGAGYKPIISEEQYRLFIQLRNNEGELYESKLPPAPRGERPLFHANHAFKILY